MDGAERDFPGEGTGVEVIQDKKSNPRKRLVKDFIELKGEERTMKDESEHYSYL